MAKAYADRRFNNGAYSDVWIIDYVVPPYNLSANWLYPIEHRTDYYNDTLNTVAHSDILNVDGTGTPIWKTNDVNIIGNEIQVNVGDLPDSTALDWANAELAGNKVILSEANKTAGASRFPMPVKGYEFKFGSTPYYTYPYVYGFYSDLTTNSPNLETAYHFYGLGDYPSYFGGDMQIVGSATVGGENVLTIADTVSTLATIYDVSQATGSTPDSVIYPYELNDSNYVRTDEIGSVVQGYNSDLDNPDLALNLIQDSLTVKLNRSEMDLAPNLIQDSLDVKLNRSEYSASTK